MKRIIVADDSATARMFIKRCLQIIGLEDAVIVEARHGKEALTAAKAQPVDLLLTDLNMPVMDGETLLKWIKANPRLMKIPVIIITSAGNQAKEQELLELGALKVVNKPVTPPALLAALEEFIDI